MNSEPQTVFVKNGQPAFNPPASPLELYRSYILRQVTDLYLWYWPNTFHATATVQAEHGWLYCRFFGADAATLYVRVDGDRSLEVCISPDCDCEVRVLDGVLSFRMDDDTPIDPAKDFVTALYQALMDETALTCLEAVIWAQQTTTA